MEGLHPNTNFNPESNSFWTQRSTAKKKEKQNKNEGCEKQLQIYLAGC